MQSDWWVPKFRSGHAASIFRRPVKIQPENSSKTFTTMYHTLTQTALWILTSLSTSNPMPKNIKHWGMNGNVTLGKLKYRKAECIVQTQYLTLCILSNSCECSVSYFASQTNWGNAIWNTSWLVTLSAQIHILGPGTHKMNFKILLKWYHKKNHSHYLNVERSQSFNCLHCTQLSPLEIN